MKIHELNYWTQLVGITPQARKFVERTFKDPNGDHQVPKSYQKEVTEAIKELKKVERVGVKICFDYMSH